MAWRYPKYDLRSGHVLDIGPINENFLPYTSEASGALDEHNFDSDAAVLTREQLAEDAAFVLHHSAPAITAMPSPTDYITKSNWETITTADDWQTYDSKGLTLSFVAKGGTVWICGSLQLINGTGTHIVTNDTGYRQAWQKGYGFAVALKVDGNTINESLLGSGDTTNEYYRGYMNFGANLYASDTNLATPQGGGGVSGARLPVSVDAVLELAPGPHVVEIAVMNIRGHSQSSPSDPNCYIATRELFALEMLR